MKEMLRKSTPYLLGLCTLLLCSPRIAAQDWDPFPQLQSGSHLAVLPELDGPHWNPARECLREFSSKAGASYYAAAVNVSAASGVATPQYGNAVPYVDALYQDWLPGGRLDPDTHILMVISLKNRGVAIHPGTRWADLGFAGPAIKTVIDRSAFAGEARGGNYAAAFCRLAEAVDTNLGHLRRNLLRRAQEHRATIDEWQKKSDRFADQVPVIEAKHPKVASALRDQLSKLDHLLGQARAADRRGRYQEVVALRQDFQTFGLAIEQNLAYLGKFEKLLPKAREELERQGRRLSEGRAASSGTFAPARDAFAQCSGQVERIETGLENGSIFPPKPLESCLQEIEQEILQAEKTDRMLFFYLPAGFGALALLFVTLFLLRERHRRNRALAATRRELDRWNGHLINAAQRLLLLETEHPLYFTSLSGTWTGESRELDQECADAVNHVFLLYSKAFELKEEAERLFARAQRSPLSSKAFEQVQALLSTTEVRFQLGEAEERKILLPLRREYQGTAASLLDDLEPAYAAASQSLRHVTELAEERDKAQGHIAALSGEVLAALETRQELGLPVGPLQDALEPHLRDLKRTETDYAQDPISAAELLLDLADPFTELRERILTGNEVAVRLRGPLRELGEELRKLAESLRTQGLELPEPGFEPALFFSRLRARARAIERALEQCDEEAASRRFEELSHEMQRLQEQLHLIETAREDVPARLREIDLRRADLQGRVPGARDLLRILSEEHAPSTFHIASDNLEELAVLLGPVDETLTKIRGDFDAEHYLAALTRLDDLDELFTAGEELIDEISRSREFLESRRESARQRLRHCRDAKEELQEKLQRQGQGNTLRRRGARWLESLDELGPEFMAERPDWPRLDRLVTTYEYDLAALDAALDLAVRDLERCLEYREKSMAFLNDLARQVEKETMERSEIAQNVTQAVHIWNEWSREVDQDQLSGTELLDKSLAVERATTQAAEAWNQELEHIRKAREKQQKALRALRSTWDTTDRKAADRLEMFATTADWQEVEKETTQLVVAQEKRLRAERAARAEASSSSSSTASSSASSIWSGSSSGGSSFGGGFSGGSSFGSSSSGGSTW